MNATTQPLPDAKRARDTTKVLAECRDLAIARLSKAFGVVIDKIGDTLLDRASMSDVREEQQLYMDARQILQADKRSLLGDFERKLRRRIDDRIAGREEPKQEFAAVDATKLTLVDTVVMDESVVTGNIKRVVENLCADELSGLNRGMGFLLGQPDLETDGNPLSPATIVDAFADALKNVKGDDRIRFQILREVNQAPLAEINAIYADVNKHLTERHVVPGAHKPSIVQRGERGRAAQEPRPAVHPPSTPEVDVMALFQRMFASPPRAGGAPAAAAAPPGGLGGPASAMPPLAAPPSFGAPSMPAEGGEGSLDFPEISSPTTPTAPTRMFAPLATTPSGYVPGQPIISTPDLHEGLVRLQAGQTSFDVGGAHVQFSGIPAGLHNVLRDLQESPLGRKANQLESMTIEMVAMLFDFIFETRDLPDGIKALLARLQIPVLKAAMLDGAFFAKKSHPARLLVNEMAQAGLGWSPSMGTDDPLYRKLDAIVRSVIDDFADDLGLFETLRDELRAFLAEEEQAAESNIATSAEEIAQHDRYEIALAVSRAEVERRIESYPVPTFLATFLRQNWQRAMTHVYVGSGEDSEAWNSTVTTLEDLVWSVQPKRSQEDRRHLVALLPSLLKRLSAGMQQPGWPLEDRERFMANLVEAHAAAVKPSLAHVESPTAAVAEQAKAQAEVAKAAGDQATAQKAEALAEAMAPAPPAPEEPEREIQDDEYLEIAKSLERGMWVEFEGEDGQLAFAKLAWVSPLRGTYLFTNRQGQKALSITAEELAESFRNDRARLVEAEPLIDRALTSVMVQMEEKFAA